MLPVMPSPLQLQERYTTLAAASVALEAAAAASDEATPEQAAQVMAAFKALRNSSDDGEGGGENLATLMEARCSKFPALPGMCPCSSNTGNLLSSLSLRVAIRGLEVHDLFSPLTCPC